MLLHDPESPRTLAVGEKLITPTKVGDQTYRQEIFLRRTPPYRYNDLFLLIIQARQARYEPVFEAENDWSYATALKIIQFLDHLPVYLHPGYVLVPNNRVALDRPTAPHF